MERRVSAFIALTVVAAAAAATTVYYALPSPTPEQQAAVFVLCVLGLVAELLMYRMPHAASGSIAYIPLLAAALISPSLLTALGIGAVTLLAQIQCRNPLRKALFNVAQLVLASSVSILAYQGLSGTPLTLNAEGSLSGGVASLALPAGVMVVVYLTINYITVCTVIALSEGISVIHVLKQNAIRTVVVYSMLSSPIVVVLAFFYLRIGPWGAIVFALPLLGVRQLHKTTLELGRVSEELLQLMVKAIEARDPYTSGHSRRVAHYSKIIARAIGLSAKQVERVGTAALLHDVGKIHEIYAPILQKPDKLTQEEWAIMQTHPIKSAELVATVSHLQDLVAPIRHHHENWDGSGYPDGLSEEAIPLESRIIMFADTIDAMTSDRPYRRALGEQAVREELVKCRGKQFDPNICDRLLASPSFSMVFAPNQRELTPRANRAIQPLRRPTRQAAGA
jgi:HD-GYP domain-containing protein (c-di-GMP phosphodiesterase class II)